MLTEDSEIGALHDSTEAGLAGTHAPAGAFEFLAAPATATERNTARLRLIPVACWRVDDIRFAFDSSFVTPEVRQELSMLVGLRDAHKDAASQFPPLSVFGHADPVGSDQYNKALSGRRATAIYALLIHNSEPSHAVALWQQIASQEDWGKPQHDAMRQALGLPPSSSPSELIPGYLKAICPPELQLTRKDFLGQGLDPQGKADYQGCSEFNPLLIFSQQAETEFEQAEDHSARNTANATNRRVLILLFRPGSKVEPARWPCPRANEGIAGCQRRFWSDGEQRRGSRLPDRDREFPQSRDTFACRFFQRLSASSPCHRRFFFFRMRLYEPMGKFIAAAPYRLTVGKLISPVQAADDKGFIAGRNIQLPNTCIVEWAFPPPPERAGKPVTFFPFKIEVFLTLDAADQQEKAVQMLNNLGYPAAGGSEENLADFQTDYRDEWRLTPTGQLDSRTKTALNQVHTRCEADLRKTRDTNGKPT